MRDSSRHIAVLMTCHNRREKTVASLDALWRSAEQLPATELRVFLTDDGSTDGTTAAVRELGMDVTIVPGPGDLYWNRGMVRAWEAAIRTGQRFDGFLLLNDDTILDEGALEILAATDREYGGEAIVVGAVRDPSSGRLSYGGVRRASPWHPGKVIRAAESDENEEVDTFNANCVLIPWCAYERIGMLDSTFTHGMGDFDYGLRAKRAGFRVMVAPGTIGTCARNDATGSWRDPMIGMRQRLRLLESPKGLPRREWREYLRRHGAPVPWLLAWSPTLRVMQSVLSVRWSAAGTSSDAR